jgi:formylglycine-generating enzyme
VRGRRHELEELGGTLRRLRVAGRWVAVAGAVLLLHCGAADGRRRVQGDDEGGEGGNAAGAGALESGGTSGEPGALPGGGQSAGGDPVNGSVSGTANGGEGTPAAAGGAASGGEATMSEAGAAQGGAGPEALSCAGVRSQSCQGLTTTCRGESCCAEALIPAISNVPYKATGATVSLNAFWLDKYEVTVGRFRKFVESFDVCRAAGAPASGAGRGVAAGTGWDAAWNISQLAEDQQALVAGLAANPKLPFQTWGNADESMPISCVNWYEAFAFCIWDGGRLPTELEWEHAASDDLLKQSYPWGDTPIPTDMQDSTTSYAVYNCMADGSSPNVNCSALDLPAVGSRPLGHGNWGHLDLAGSMSEWVFDWFGPTYEDYPASASCDNCANLAPGGSRVIRGGNWNFDYNLMQASYRGINQPLAHSEQVGFRCARNP